VYFAVYIHTKYFTVCSPVTLRKQVSAVTSLFRNTSSGMDVPVIFAVRTTSNEPCSAGKHRHASSSSSSSADCQCTYCNTNIAAFTAVHKNILKTRNTTKTLNNKS